MTETKGLIPIPAGAEEITPGWIDAVLKNAGAIEDAEILDVSLRHVPAGTGGGFLSDLVFASISYRRQDGSREVPTSLVIKLPRPNAALTQPRYAAEIRFYSSLAQHAPVPLPKSYYAKMDQATGDFAIVMDDLSYCRQGDETVGSSLAEARVVVQELARVHAAFWEGGPLNPLIQDLTYSIPVGDPESDWAATIERFGSLLPDELREAGQMLAGMRLEVRRELERPPCTLNHGDFRLDNLLFPPPEERLLPPFVLDWQFINRARGPADLGYFLSGSVRVEEMLLGETELVALYHQQLVNEGVIHYPFEECLRDYRLGILAAFGRWIYAARNLRPEADPTNKLNQLFHRSAAAAARFDAVALLNELHSL